MPGPEATDRQVAEFWETRSVADYWDELAPADIRPRAGPRRVVSVRLDPEAVRALRALARRRGIGYSALARTFISQRLMEELAATAAR